MKSVTLGTKEYMLFKVGRGQAEQVVSLTKWLAKYGGEFFEAAQDENGNVAFNNIADIFIKVSTVLTVDALVDLYRLIIGCTPKEADEYFDIAQLIDVATSLFEEQPSFKRVIERFFSPKQSIEGTESNSTQSEAPMDGQTK